MHPNTYLKLSFAMGSISPAKPKWTISSILVTRVLASVFCDSDIFACGQIQLLNLFLWVICILSTFSSNFEISLTLKCPIMLCQSSSECLTFWGAYII